MAWADFWVLLSVSGASVCLKQFYDFLMVVNCCSLNGRFTVIVFGIDRSTMFQ